MYGDDAFVAGLLGCTILNGLPRALELRDMQRTLLALWCSASHAHSFSSQ